MTSNFDLALAHVLEHEGGYANDPRDSGGETYAGVSRKNWPNWAGWKIVDRLKPSNKAMAENDELQNHLRQFYLDNFWLASKSDQLPDAVGRKHFNAAVNVGVKQANKLLQRAVGATDDGVIGPKTLAAANALSSNPEMIVDRYCEQQKLFYLAIIRRKPSYAVFRKGWLRRAAYRG